MLACRLLLDMWLEISHWSCYRGHVWLLNSRTWQSSRSLTDLQIQPNPVGSSVFSSTLYEHVTEDWQAAFVFNIFIRLFSLFLFVLKFILSLLDLFFFLHDFSHLTHLNKITKNDFMFTWQTFLLASPGCHLTTAVQHCVRKFHFNQHFTISTARFKNTLEYLLGWKLEKLQGCKEALSPVRYSLSAQVYLTVIQ